MGVTAASLHILVPPLGISGDPRAAVERAYARLGWGAPVRGKPPQRSCLLAADSGQFVSVYDSACAELDDGTLKQLAVLISKSLATTAIVTTVLHGDDFEFILFRAGKQVDAAVGGPDGPNGGLKSVRGRRQAALWHDAFGGAHFREITGGAGKLVDRLALFVARAGEAATLASPLAEDRLGAWCALSGLSVQAALARGTDRIEDGRVVARLDLAARRLPRASPAFVAPLAREFAFLPSTEGFPYHGFYPAAWPILPDAQRSVTWPVTCRNGGLQGFRVSLHMDRTGGFLVRKLSVAAYSFYNGQIMSPTPLASFGQTMPDDIAQAAADIAIDAENFNLREPAPGSRSHYILLIRADLQSPDAGEVMMTPSFRADGAAAALILPTLRLAVTRATWVPIVADALDETPARQEALLRLNVPSLHTAVAILPDTGDDVRSAIRFLLEQSFAPATRADLTATVHTEKHMTPGFSVPKATQTVPVQTLLQGALWQRLFETVGQYQTVRIGIGLPGAPLPLAGFLVQTSLRDAQDEDPSATRFGGPTIAVATWAVAEQSALSMLGLDQHAMLNSFTAWLRGAAPLQAWAADCAWIPDFDHYDNYELTPYETVSQVDWFRRALKGTLTDRAWLRKRLRFVAPLLWLGWELAELVDTAAISSFAHVVSIDDGVEIALRDAEDLNRLEMALSGVLPLGV
jgi:hypothetical protein